MPLPPPRSHPPPSKAAASASAASAPISSIRAHPLFQQRRRVVFVGAVAVITVAGSLLGATLKSRRQFQEKSNEKNVNEVESTVVAQRQQSRQEHLDANRQLQMLETRRGQLMQQKIGLERKIGELRERCVRKEEEKRRVQEMRVMGGDGDGEQGVGRR